MKRHIWYHIVLTIFAAWCGTGCSEGYEYFNPNPGDEEQQASPIVNTGKASVDAAAGKATLNGNWAVPSPKRDSSTAARQPK